MADTSNKPSAGKRLYVNPKVGDMIDDICNRFGIQKTKLFNELLKEALRNKNIVENVVGRLSDITNPEEYNEAMDNLKSTFRFEKSSMETKASTSGGKRGRKPYERDSNGNIIRPQKIEGKEVVSSNSSASNASYEKQADTEIPMPNVPNTQKEILGSGKAGGSKVEVASNNRGLKSSKTHADKRVDGEIDFTF